MKKLTITLLLSSFSLLIFAQTPFTEQIFRDMNQRLQTDYAKAVIDEISPDYTFTMGNGFVATYDQMKGWDKSSKVTEWTLSDVKIKQGGTMAVVTGINKHGIMNLQTKAVAQYNMRFTYVYEYKNKQWKWLTAHHSDIVPTNEEKPEDIVKQWIREYNKDSRAFFMDRCTDDFIASNNGGKFFGKKPLEGLKSGMTNDTELSDMKSHQSGDLAVVTGIMTYHHRQPDGTDNIDKNVFTFTTVKKNGKWMYAMHHFSSMIEEKPEEVLKTFLTEYHKNPKAFFENRLPEDFRFLNGGKENVSKAGVISNSKNDPTDSEVSDVKAFQSGNLGVVSGFHVFKNRQADGNIKADKVAFTYTFQKKNGKWFFAESHQTPVKE